MAAIRLVMQRNTNPPLAAPEGASSSATRTKTTCNPKRTSEAYSRGTIPVWVKAQRRKVKVNAILDDESNKSFPKEEVTGFIGLQEPYHTVKVNVLNNSVKTFLSMPLASEVESVNGQLSKQIMVKACPRNVTGGFKVEDGRASQDKWPHLSQCMFPSSAKEGLVDLLIGIDNAD